LKNVRKTDEEEEEKRRKRRKRRGRRRRRRRRRRMSFPLGLSFVSPRESEDDRCKGWIKFFFFIV
jgi:hypothetical protein